MGKLKVIKKDGTITEFNITNIINTCMVAGCSKELAKEIAYKIKEDLLKIKSSKIREFIINTLKEIDPELSKSIIQFDIRKKKKREEMVQNYTV